MKLIVASSVKINLSSDLKWTPGTLKGQSEEFIKNAHKALGNKVDNIEYLLVRSVDAGITQPGEALGKSIMSNGKKINQESLGNQSSTTYAATIDGVKYMLVESVISMFNTYISYTILRPQKSS